jgi:hypothetical protein
MRTVVYLVLCSLANTVGDRNGTGELLSLSLSTAASITAERERQEEGGSREGTPPTEEYSLQIVQCILLSPACSLNVLSSCVGGE